MLCKCHWIVLYTVHFTAFCLGGPFFPDTVYILYNLHSSVRRRIKILSPNTSKLVVSTSEDNLVYKFVVLKQSDDSVLGSFHLERHPCSVSQIYMDIYVCRSMYCEISTCI